MKKSYLIEIIKDALLAEKNTPGLWANINAKRKKGKKPSHGNSNAHKDAVAAGNAMKNEAAYDNATRNELAQYIINLNNELAIAKSRGMDKEVMDLEKDIAQVKAALAAKKAIAENRLIEKQSQPDDDLEDRMDAGDFGTNVLYKKNNEITPINIKKSELGKYNGTLDLLNRAWHEFVIRYAKDNNIKWDKWSDAEYKVRNSMKIPKSSDKSYEDRARYSMDNEFLNLKENKMENFDLKKYLAEGSLTKEWPNQISSKYNDQYIFKLVKVEPTYKDKSGRALYRVVDVATGETKGTPAFTSIEKLTAFAQDLIKPQGGTQSTNLG